MWPERRTREVSGSQHLWTCAALWSLGFKLGSVQLQPLILQPSYSLPCRSPCLLGPESHSGFTCGTSLLHSLWFCWVGVIGLNPTDPRSVHTTRDGGSELIRGLRGRLSLTYFLHGCVEGELLLTILPGGPGLTTAPSTEENAAERRTGTRFWMWPALSL